MIDLMELERRYIDAAIANGEAISNGNSRTANREYHKLTKIYKILSKDRVTARAFYSDLLLSQNYYVQIWVAAHLLGLNMDVDAALEILEQLSSRTDIGIISLEAEMTIKEWKKNGYLLF